MKRGLIIPSSMLISSYGTATRISGHVPPETIRKWVLFWDEFVCPDNNFIGTTLSDDLSLLQQIGLLSRNFVQFSGTVHSGEFARLFLAAQERTFFERDHLEPGRWAMASSEGIISEAGIHRSRSCVVFELVNAIQIPDRDVPLQDIINFRQKRRDEFEAFHQYISELHLEILRAGNIPHAKTYVLEKLERAMADINRTVEETFSSRCLAGFRTTLDKSLLGSVGIGFAAAAYAPQIGLPALSVGAFSACAAFAVKRIIAGGSPSGAQPLTYIENAITKL